MIAVIFEVEPAPGRQDAYLDIAAHLEADPRDHRRLYLGGALPEPDHAGRAAVPVVLPRRSGGHGLAQHALDHRQAQAAGAAACSPTTGCAWPRCCATTACTRATRHRQDSRAVHAVCPPVCPPPLKEPVDVPRRTRIRLYRPDFPAGGNPGVKGVVGLGLRKTVAVGLLRLVMPPSVRGVPRLLPVARVHQSPMSCGCSAAALRPADTLACSPMLVTICTGTWLCAAHLVPASG